MVFFLTLFFPMVPFDPPKTSENLWFPNLFRGIKREHWEEKGKSFSLVLWKEFRKLIKLFLALNLASLAN